MEKSDKKKAPKNRLHHYCALVSKPPFLLGTSEAGASSKRAQAVVSQSEPQDRDHRGCIDGSRDTSRSELIYREMKEKSGGGERWFM